MLHYFNFTISTMIHFSSTPPWTYIFIVLDPELIFNNGRKVVSQCGFYNNDKNRFFAISVKFFLSFFIFHIVIATQHHFTN